MASTRTIGRLAKEAGVGVETIRFYERQGLIDRPRAASGYRQYDERHLARLRYIKIAQSLGLSLKEIAALSAGLDDRQGFCASVRAVVSARLEAVCAEAARLERLQAEMQGFLRACAARDPARGCPVFEALRPTSAKPPRPQSRLSLGDDDEP